MAKSLKRRRVQAILDATSQEVAMLGLAERRSLFIVLQRAEAEVSNGLAAWLRRAGDGSQRFTEAQMRNALANIRTAMRTVRSLEPRMAGELETIRATSAQLAVRHAEEQLLQFASIFDGEIKPVNVRMAALLERGNKLLIKRHASSARRYAGEAQRHIRRQLAIGVVRGESFDDLIRRLSSLAPRKLMDATVDPITGAARGMLQLPKSSAARLVRTEAIHAYNTFHTETIAEIAEEDPEIGKRWDASLDRRGCPNCRDLDGEVVAVGEKFRMGGVEVDHPPLHPQCRCACVPWHESWKHESMLSRGTEAIDAPDPQPNSGRKAAAK